MTKKQNYTRTFLKFRLGRFHPFTGHEGPYGE